MRHPQYLFRIEIDGLESARFQKADGLKKSVEWDEYSEGGSMETEKDPGKASYENITLSRGLTDDLELYEWIEDCVDAINDGGDLPVDVKKNFDIVQLNRQLQEIRRYRVIEAGPAAWDPGSFDAEQKSGYHVETVEFVCRKWYIVR